MLPATSEKKDDSNPRRRTNLGFFDTTAPVSTEQTDQCGASNNNDENIEMSELELTKLKLRNELSALDRKAKKLENSDELSPEQHELEVKILENEYLALGLKIARIKIELENASPKLSCPSCVIL